MRQTSYLGPAGTRVEVLEPAGHLVRRWPYGISASPDRVFAALIDSNAHDSDGGVSPTHREARP